MILYHDTVEYDAALNAAKKICAAARTAPKARGIDHIQTAILTGEDKDALAKEMERLHAEEGAADFFVRDARCIRVSEVVVLVGSTTFPRGLDCGLCGFESCGACLKAKGACCFETIDLGIALGSAAGVAADERVDTRIMYSAGTAAMKLGLLDKSQIIMAIPVSVSGKSPFFDRG